MGEDLKKWNEEDGVWCTSDLNEDGSECLRNGLKKEYFKDKQTIRRSIYWKDGYKEGVEVWFWKNGGVQKRLNWKKGKEVGRQETYYRSGKIKEVRFSVNGIMEGLEEWYWENGNTKRNTYWKDGKREGVEELFKANGEIEARIFWKSDVEMEEDEWNRIKLEEALREGL